jgi:cytochrome c
MTKSLFKAALIFLCSLTISASVFASDRGTADEAIAMVKKASAYLKANGKEKAYAEFNNPNGQFKDRDLYLFVMDMSGMEYVNGGNAKLIGKNLIDLKDAEGKAMVREFIETAKTKGKGWVDYKWPNPAKKVVEQKSTYIEKVDDVLIGCGIYKG